MAGTCASKQQNSELLKELQALKEKLQAKEAENQNLTEQVCCKSSGGKCKKGRYVAHEVPVNEELCGTVVGHAKTTLWRTCKFLADETQLDEACEQIMAVIPEIAHLLEDEEMKEVNIQGFKDNYGENICTTINGKRTEVQSGLRKAYLARAATGAKMPTPKELGQVIRRVGLEFDPEKPEENALAREFFEWYWEHLLPKCVGSQNWGQSIRLYGTISQHFPPDDPKRKYITSSDEALVLLLYENCGQRFPYHAKCKAKGETPDAEHANNQSKWSNNQSGQVKWGGWPLAGQL